MYVGRFLPVVVGPVLLHLPKCRQTGCRAVAVADILRVQGCIFFERAPNEAQQVVAKVAAVFAVHHERVHGLCLRARQQRRVSQCHAAVFGSPHGGGIIEPAAVPAADETQHGGIDGTQPFVASAPQLRLHTAHHGLQRVGGHADLHIQGGQPGFEQMAVLLVAEGLGCYLVGLLYHLLWQVLFLGLLQLFPHLLITLSK